MFRQTRVLKVTRPILNITCSTISISCLMSNHRLPYQDLKKIFWIDRYHEPAT